MINIWETIKLTKEECKHLEEYSKIGSTVTDKSIDELIEIMEQVNGQKEVDNGKDA